MTRPRREPPSPAGREKRLAAAFESAVSTPPAPELESARERAVDAAGAAERAAAAAVKLADERGRAAEEARAVGGGGGARADAARADAEAGVRVRWRSPRSSRRSRSAVQPRARTPQGAARGGRRGALRLRLRGGRGPSWKRSARSGGGG